MGHQFKTAAQLSHTGFPRSREASVTIQSALNQVTKTLSIDWKPYNIFLVGIHPGWVRTAMGTDKADLSPNESAQKVAKVLSALTEKDNGGYFDWKGNAMEY